MAGNDAVKRSRRLYPELIVAGARRLCGIVRLRNSGDRCIPGLLGIVLLGALGLAARPVAAQSLWEVTPYRIQTWVALQTHPLVASQWEADLPEQIEQLADTYVGASWRLQASAIPPAFRTQVLQGDRLDTEALLEHPELNDQDKLMLIRLRVDLGGYELQVQEFDLRTLSWSDTVSRTIAVPSQLGSQAVALACDLFRPAVEIRKVTDEGVTALVRAEALLLPQESPRDWRRPAVVEPGALLRPILRKNDRNGRVRIDATEPVPWTVLVVEQKDQHGLHCKVHSGFRQPFSTRRSSRTEQLALLIKPRGSATTLRLHDRANPDQPLVGYEVYSRNEPDGPSEFVGRTDWRGLVTIEQTAEPVRLLLVKSGRHLLAKLPLVPGDQSTVEASLRNDAQRLEAEGFLQGIQEALVDLVARRELLTVQIRRRIAEGQLEKAEEMLQQLRRLDTQDEFIRRVQQRQQSLSVVDARVQQQIDRLFAETRQLLGKFLDPRRVDQLQQELVQARQQNATADRRKPS